MLAFSIFAWWAATAAATVSDVSFSQDSKWVASAALDGKVRVHAFTSSDPAKPAFVMDDTEGRGVGGVAFSRDARSIVTVAGNTAQLYAFDGKSAPQLKHVIAAKASKEGKNLTISSAVFSPTACHLALAETGSVFDNAIYIYDICSASAPELKSTNKEPPRCHGCVQLDLTSLAFSADGQWLASGCNVNDLRVYSWNEAASAAELYFTLHGKEGFVPADITALAFSPDSRLLVATYTDYAVQTFGYRDHGTESPGGWGWKQSVSFGGFAADVSPDGRWLATGSAEIRHTPAESNKLYVRALDDKHVMGEAQVLDDTDGRASAVSFSGDSKWLAVAASPLGAAGHVSIYSLEGGKAALQQVWKDDAGEVLV